MNAQRDMTAAHSRSRLAAMARTLHPKITAQPGKTRFSNCPRLEASLRVKNSGRYRPANESGFGIVEGGGSALKMIGLINSRPNHWLWRCRKRFRRNPRAIKRYSDP